MNYNTKIEVEKILLIENQLTVFFEWDEETHIEEIKNTLFGKEYMIYEKQMHTRMKKKITTTIEKDMADILRIYQKTANINNFISKEIRVGKFRGENIPSNDFGISIIQNRDLIDSLNSVYLVKDVFIQIDTYELEKEVRRLLTFSYPEHDVYTNSGVISIYKKIPFKMVGRFGGGINCFDISFAYSLEKCKYYIEQPEYYENFNFMGIIPSTLKLSEAKDSDFQVIENNEQYLKYLNKELEKLNKNK